MRRKQAAANRRNLRPLALLTSSSIAFRSVHVCHSLSMQCSSSLNVANRPALALRRLRCYRRRCANGGNSMTNEEISRREWLASASAGVAAGRAQAERKDAPAFRLCLNTATIMGQNLSLAQEIEITAKAGYDAIEPWLSKLEKHAKDGGSLKDIG